MGKYYLLFLLIGLCACSVDTDKEKPLFELLDVKDTGIDYENNLKYNERVNPYTFRNFYNGAGVALGDINNDGLVDIFFAGNQGDNKLFLNRGSFSFEDITLHAGIASPGVWSTGVSMSDINGDGFLDIYICKSGPPGGKNRHNELYINNGDQTFTEMSHKYGLAEEGLSQHAVFFDFDKDGNLDMYLLSNSLRPVGINDLRKGQRDIRDSLGGNKLYRNDGDKFTDVSEEAGIYGSAIGYGLGVTVADINKDGWPDLYVSNDFFEKDYLYINNKDGTFTESLEDMVTEISLGAMGADIADLNNDGWPDIFVTEMLPQDWERVKTKTPFEDWDKYQANVKAGYYHQFTRNTLQRNLGPKPGSQQVHFSEIARMSGVHATDWSWGALIFDMDNDGLKDIFVANGIAKDLTDFDYVDYYINNQDLVAEFKRDSILLTKMIDEFPSQPIRNFLFKNLGDFHFKNLADSLGMSVPSFSNGAAYGDLDNDGDLDLVVSNINGPAFIYKNNSEIFFDHHYLQFELGNNFGTKIQVFAGEENYYVEHYPVKGYMSSVDQRAHLGLGINDHVDSLWVTWPNGDIDRLYNLETNQVLALEPDGARNKVLTRKEEVFPMLKMSSKQIPFHHQESSFVDFDRDRMRFFMISNEGPRAAVGDVNGDGLDEVFLTGAKGQASELFLQQKGGDFVSFQKALFQKEAMAEDVDALFFDASGNGALDLYVASGGIEFGNSTPVYQDRLYLNDGSGNFQKASLPHRFESTSFVKALDYNQDGKMDLLIGTRAVPYLYGVPVDVVLLENTGNGQFKDVTESRAPEFIKAGMSRDALVFDMDRDGYQEILLVGEWMPLKLFRWVDDSYKDISDEAGLSDTEGLWQSVQVGDFNQDGFPDFLAGNWGKNTRLNASKEKPLQMHINDFNQNGSVAHILTVYEGEKRIPVVMKSSLLKQLPGLRKELLTYAAYKDKTLEDLFPEEILQNSMVLNVKTMETKLFLNNGNGGFYEGKLPDFAQASPVFAIYVGDITQNGKMDALLGGNQSKVKPELGINMAHYGVLLENEGDARLEWVLPQEAGLYVQGEIRDIKAIQNTKGKSILMVRNNARPIIYEFTTP